MLTINTKVDGSQLVTSPEKPHKLTRHRERGVRGALTRGLSEFIKTLQYDASIGGRRVAFSQVFNDRAVWEDGKPKFPSALCKTEGQFTYDSQSFAPQVEVEAIWENDATQGGYLLQTSECTGQLIIEVWATDPDERELIVTMLEDGLFPVEWMAGFRLDLPHYFGARAEYLLTDTNYLDSPEEAMQRYCKAMLTLEARCPVLQLFRAGTTKARVINDTED